MWFARFKSTVLAQFFEPYPINCARVGRANVTELPPASYGRRTGFRSLRVSGSFFEGGLSEPILEGILSIRLTPIWSRFDKYIHEAS